MSAHAQVSYLKDEKNASFRLMSEEDAAAFLDERSFFKLKAFAKDFEKYAGGPIPLWTLLELISLGPLTRLYRHCFGKAGAIDDPEEREMFSAYRGLLKCTQQLRNAAAHNDCLLNGLATHEKKSGVYPKIRKALAEDYGMDPDVVAQVGSMRVAMDLAAVLICYDAYVPRGGSRSRAGLALSAARERFAKHAPWFDKTYAVKSFLDYADLLFEAFSTAFSGQGDSDERRAE